MAVVSTATLKGYFNTGDTPTEAQYIDLIDTLAALPASGSGPARVELTDSGLTCSALYYGSGTITLSETATGQYTVTFPSTTTPSRCVVAFTDANLDGSGGLELIFVTGASLSVYCHIGLRRQDAGKLVVFDPLGEFAINCAETVSAGSTSLAFGNVNNLGSTGGVFTIEMLNGLEAS